MHHLDSKLEGAKATHKFQRCAFKVMHYNASDDAQYSVKAKYLDTVKPKTRQNLGQAAEEKM